MEIVLKNLAMADGEMFEEVTADVPEDFLERFMSLRAGGSTYYIDPEYIVSFEAELNEKKKPIVLKIPR